MFIEQCYVIHSCLSLYKYVMSTKVMANYHMIAINQENKGNHSI